MRGDKMNYTIKNQDLLLEISNHGAEIKVIKYQNIDIYTIQIQNFGDVLHQFYFLILEQ